MNNMLTTGKLAVFACFPVLLEIPMSKVDNVAIIKDELTIVLVIIAIMYQSVSLYKTVFKKNNGQMPPNQHGQGDII